MFLAGIALPVFVLLAPFPKASRFFGAFLNAGHLFLGALVVAAIYMLLRRGTLQMPLAAVTSWLLGFFLLGCLEGVQGFVGRGPSWNDVAANGLGGAVALVWFLGVREDGSRLWGWTLCMGTLLLLVGLARPILHGIDAIRQTHAFPLLASFEDPLELSRWRPSDDCSMTRTHRNATHGKYALRVDMQPGPWPGVTMRAPPRDKRFLEYTSLALAVAVEDSEPLAITVKIADMDHRETYEDAFHLTATLAPGSHTLRIPLSDVAHGAKDRVLDLTRVLAIQIFVESLRGPRTFYLDHMRLE